MLWVIVLSLHRNETRGETEMNESTQKEAQKLEKEHNRLSGAIFRGIVKLQELKGYYEHSESEECAQHISRQIKAIAADRIRREDTLEKRVALNKA